VLSDYNYVVLESPKRLKQTVTRSGLMKEKPNVSNRRGLMEFGILQYSEECGGRRNRNTTLISRKDSSLAQLTDPGFSSSYKSEHLLKLKLDLKNKLKATNLSTIMSDPNFLIACWVRVRSNKNSITPVFDSSIDGIKKVWFTETAVKVINGGYKFQAVRGGLGSLTVLSSKDKIVQEGVRLLLELIFEPSSKSGSYNQGCLAALNGIRMECNSCS